MTPILTRSALRKAGFVVSHLHCHLHCIRSATCPAELAALGVQVAQSNGSISCVFPEVA